MRQVCTSCGWAGPYLEDGDELEPLEMADNCPRCSSPLTLQTERFHHAPNNLTNAEDLDSGDPYLWDQEICDADDA